MEGEQLELDFDETLKLIAELRERIVIVEKRLQAIRELLGE